MGISITQRRGRGLFEPLPRHENMYPCDKEAAVAAAEQEWEIPIILGGICGLPWSEAEGQGVNRPSHAIAQLNEQRRLHLLIMRVVPKVIGFTRIDS